MTASLYVDSSDNRLSGDQKVIRYKCYIMLSPIKKMLLKSNLFISIPVAGWQETFRSPASRLAGDFSASDRRLAGDQKVSYQPAGRRLRLS